MGASKRDSRDAERKAILNSAEYTVFQRVLRKSSFGAVLNEGDIARDRCRSNFRLPTRGRIIPDELYEQRKHPDVRIARRATTIAALARVISEREVSKGLRRTLMTQADGLNVWRRQRYNEISGKCRPSNPAKRSEWIRSPRRRGQG